MGLGMGTQFRQVLFGHESPQHYGFQLKSCLEASLLFCSAPQQLPDTPCRATVVFNDAFLSLLLLKLVSCLRGPAAEGVAGHRRTMHEK